MAFGISGYGAQQIYPAPALFQALSLANAPPQPPNPPYGTPNPNLVDVQRTGNPAVPANLTLAAHSTFDAILKINAGQTVVAYGHPPVAPVANTTNAVNATNPAVAGQVQGTPPSGIPSQSGLPQGPVSFTLTVAPANFTSGADALQQTLAQLERGQPQQSTTAPAVNAGTSSSNAVAGSASDPASPAAPSPAPSRGAGTIPAVASPSFVGRIVQTVQALAVAAVYRSPIFSFSA